MKYRFFVYILCSMIAVGQQSKQLTATENFAIGVIQAFAKIASNGGKAWEDLGKGQATDILQRVSDEAVKLESDKNDLRQYMSEHKPDSNAIRNEVFHKVSDLKVRVRAIRTDLDQFGVELDKAAHPVGEDLRVAINKAETAKIYELDKVSDAWQNGRADESLNNLDLAIARLEDMRTGIACLHDSITAKRAVCDSRTLKRLPA